MPAGALHAAKALTNHSVMVANNDQTFQDMEIIHSVCSQKQAQDHVSKQVCSQFSRKRHSMRQNKKRFGSHVVRQDTPVLEVCGCSRAQLCEAFGQDDIMEAWVAYCGVKVPVEL